MDSLRGPGIPEALQSRVPSGGHCPQTASPRPEDIEITIDVAKQAQ